MKLIISEETKFQCIKNAAHLILLLTLYVLIKINLK